MMGPPTHFFLIRVKGQYWSKQVLSYHSHKSQDLNQHVNKIQFILGHVALEISEYKIPIGVIAMFCFKTILFILPFEKCSEYHFARLTPNTDCRQRALFSSMLNVFALIFFTYFEKHF